MINRVRTEWIIVALVALIAFALFMILSAGSSNENIAGLSTSIPTCQEWELNDDFCKHGKISWSSDENGCSVVSCEMDLQTAGFLQRLSNEN